MKKGIRIYKSQINELLSDAKSILEMNYNKITTPVGEVLYGWHNFFEKKVGPPGAALPLIYFKHIQESFAETERVLETLVNLKKDTEGGYSAWSILHVPQSNTIEGTVLPTLALIYHNSKGCYNTIIEGAISWISEQRLKDGGWNSNGDENNLARVNLTCNVLELFEEAKGYHDIEIFESGINWLVSVQNENGSWGETENADGNVFYTAKALKTLVKSGRNISKQNINKALEFIISNYHKDMSFVSETYDINLTEGYNRIVLEHDVRAEIISLYVVMHNMIHDEFIFRVLSDALEYYKLYKFKNKTNNYNGHSIWTIIPMALAIFDLYDKCLPITNQSWILLFNQFIISDKDKSIRSNLHFLFLYIIEYIKSKKRLFLWLLSVFCIITVVILFVLEVIDVKDVILSIIIPVIMFLLGLREE